MKFRVLSDLHIDINEGTVPSFDDDVFTVVCGDTSGDPAESINWIRKNVRRGVGVSGNHLPYNDRGLEIQALRDELAEAFPKDGPFTYLDAECGTVSKVVDGVMFVGSCFYSDMKIACPGNWAGDVESNKIMSAKRLNDYKWGIRRIEGGGRRVYMTPDDCVEWNARALEAVDKAVTENEKSENPLPVAVVTHYPMIREVGERSIYVDGLNLASYCSDMKWWFEKHPSVKCHCCGHCHNMPEDFRSFKAKLAHGDLLVVNNSFGYAREFHDLTFNPNRCVDTDKWEVAETPEPEAVREEKKAREERLLKILAMFA